MGTHLSYQLDCVSRTSLDVSEKEEGVVAESQRAIGVWVLGSHLGTGSTSLTA